LSNFFDFTVAGNTNKTLFYNITNLTSSSSKISFCIKFEDTDTYPDGYSIQIGITQVMAITLNCASNGDKTWGLYTPNTLHTYAGLPTYVTILLDSDNGVIGVYADGVALDTISDTITIDTSSDFVIANTDATTTTFKFTEVLFFDRILTDAEALLSSTGFVTPSIGVSGLDVRAVSNTSIYVELSELTITPLPVIASVYIYIESDVSITLITPNKVIETPDEYMVQHWSFTNQDGTGTKLDTTGANGFTDGETSVKDDLPSIISIPKNYLYYRPVWTSANYDSGSGTVTVAGEAQLSGLQSGSKSFSFWIYRPFIAEVSDNTTITIDGDYAFYVSPSFGNTKTVNGDWSLVVIVYDYYANNRRTYVDNVLFKTDTYAEIGNGKIVLCETQMGQVDAKVAIRDIMSYSYALSTQDIDLIYNFYYKYMIVRPDIVSLVTSSLFTEGWYYKCNNELVVDIVPNIAFVNDFINKFVQQITSKIVIIPLAPVVVNEMVSLVTIIPMPPITLGEAYIDFKTTAMCDLYHDTPILDTLKNEVVGTRYITTALIPFNKDTSTDTTRVEAIDTSLYTSDKVKSVVKSRLYVDTYGSTFIPRVNGRGYALSMQGVVNPMNIVGVIHTFVFCVTSAPTSRAYLCKIAGLDLSVRIDSNMMIQVSKDGSNFTTVQIQPLKLNVEYVIKFDYMQGVYLNSYNILDGYADLYADLYPYFNDGIPIKLETFGSVDYDTAADVLTGYVCNYKIYTYDITYDFNYVEYIETVLGTLITKKIAELTDAFKSQPSTSPTLPYCKNVFTKYVTMPTIPNITTYTNIPNYVGEVSISTTVTPFPAVINIYQNFLKPPKNVYILTKPTTLICNALIRVCDFVQPLTNIVHIISNPVIIGGTQERKCVKIDNITLTNSLKLSATESIKPIMTSSVMAIDGSTIVFPIMPPVFSIQSLLYTSPRDYEDYDIISELKSLLDTGTHIMYFNDGSYSEFIFDILNTPLSYEPIYEGSDHYKLKIRILV